MIKTKLLSAMAGGSETLYVDDVFSTYLYTGNGSTQMINNGIDLAGKGGLVWTKDRSSASNNLIFDTVSGLNKWLRTNDTSAYITSGVYGPTSFSSNGYTVADWAGNIGFTSPASDNYVSWTFRKAPKFFDCGTYVGNGGTKTISHSLGVAPGMVIVKEASAAGNDWQVYHRSTTNTCGRLFLNLTNAENATNRANTWGDNTNPVVPTASVFTVGNTGGVNNNGATYVWYAFAHDTSTDGIVQCGSLVPSSIPFNVNLGWEPQYILVKNASAVGDWFVAGSAGSITTGGSSTGYVKAEKFSHFLDPPRQK